MGCEVVLVGMELAGLGINQQEYEDTRLVLEARCRILEETAFRYRTYPAGTVPSFYFPKLRYVDNDFQLIALIPKVLLRILTLVRIRIVS